MCPVRGDSGLDGQLAGEGAELEDVEVDGGECACRGLLAGLGWEEEGGTCRIGLG